MLYVEKVQFLIVKSLDLMINYLCLVSLSQHNMGGT